MYLNSKGLRLLSHYIYRGKLEFEIDVFTNWIESTPAGHLRLEWIYTNHDIFSMGTFFILTK